MKSTHTRIDRLGDLIKREVSEILLREVQDPRVTMVTITHAAVASDLKHAKIFFSTLKTGRNWMPRLPDLSALRVLCSGGWPSASIFAMCRIFRFSLTIHWHRQPIWIRFSGSWREKEEHTE